MSSENYLNSNDTVLRRKEVQKECMQEKSEEMSHLNRLF